MGAGEWQQIVGMHLNETNYYMLTAFTMADLKEMGSFNLAPQGSLQRKLIPLTVCISEFNFFSPSSSSSSSPSLPWTETVRGAPLSEFVYMN